MLAISISQVDGSNCSPSKYGGLNLPNLGVRLYGRVIGSAWFTTKAGAITGKLPGRMAHVKMLGSFREEPNPSGRTMPEPA